MPCNTRPRKILKWPFSGVSVLEFHCELQIERPRKKRPCCDASKGKGAKNHSETLARRPGGSGWKLRQGEHEICSNLRQSHSMSHQPKLSCRWVCSSSSHQDPPEVPDKSHATSSSWYTQRPRVKDTHQASSSKHGRDGSCDGLGLGFRD